VSSRQQQLLLSELLSEQRLLLSEQPSQLSDL
jgi:hypothetical protein